jgi:hypothetical protein
VSLDEGLQFHLESDRTQNILELPLLVIAPVDGESGRLHDAPAVSGRSPELVVVEVAREALPRRVVDILYIDE